MTPKLLLFPLNTIDQEGITWVGRAVALGSGCARVQGPWEVGVPAVGQGLYKGREAGQKDALPLPRTPDGFVAPPHEGSVNDPATFAFFLL